MPKRIDTTAGVPWIAIWGGTALWLLIMSVIILAAERPQQINDKNTSLLTASIAMTSIGIAFVLGFVGWIMWINRHKYVADVITETFKNPAGDIFRNINPESRKTLMRAGERQFMKNPRMFLSGKNIPTERLFRDMNPKTRKELLQVARKNPEVAKRISRGNFTNKWW